MEEWRQVESHPNYIISNTGRIKRNGVEKDHSIRDRKGYYITDLYRDGRRSVKRINRLVAEAFIPNPENKPEVNHKDGNKHNNNVSNLEWMTKQENCRHASEMGLVSHKPSYGMLGKKNPNGGRKRRPFKIVETGETFGSLRECEEQKGFNNKHVNDCLRGRQKTHRGYHFEYI